MEIGRPSLIFCREMDKGARAAYIVCRMREQIAPQIRAIRQRPRLSQERCGRKMEAAQSTVSGMEALSS